MDCISLRQTRKGSVFVFIGVSEASLNITMALTCTLFSRPVKSLAMISSHAAELLCYPGPAGDERVTLAPLVSD